MKYNRQKLIQELSEWIDTDVLAETTVDMMKEYAESDEMTVDNAKKIWLRFLDDLSDNLKSVIKMGF